ncbi:uncharacterized protein YggE [Rhodobacteraceae bacterium MBR-64]|jgi:uncharacterized protein YggE
MMAKVRRMLGVLGVLGLAGALCAGAAFAQDLAQMDTGRLVVTGEGRVAAAPDMAMITLGVRSDARTARDALAHNSERVATVLDGLRAAGIAARDMQTSGLSLGPNWENRVVNGQPQNLITGFTAANMVTVRVRDLSGLGAILDKVVADGANTFNGLQFDLQDRRASLDKARHRAVLDARQKADLYAKAAGLTLGPVLTLTEQGGGARPQPMFAREMSMAADKVPLAEGEIDITAQVEIVFAIKSSSP